MLFHSVFNLMLSYEFQDLLQDSYISVGVPSESMRIEKYILVLLLYNALLVPQDRLSR